MKSWRQNRNASPDAGPGVGRYGRARVERLEGRRLLAAASAPFEASFDFGPAREPAIAGYYPDHGAAFGDRGNGLEYGWSVNEASHAHLSRSKLAPGPQYDGSVGFTPGQSWEVAVPDGSYQVYLALGNASTTAGFHEVDIEGTPVSFTSTRKLRWQEWTVNVTISNGYLQVSAPRGMKRLKADTIDFIDVSAPSSAGAVTTPGTSSGLDSPPIAGDWHLSFDDEFNSLNTNVWTNGDYWWDGNDGTQATFEPGNVSVANGILTITAKRQSTRANNDAVNPYSSGLLQSGGIQGVTSPGFSFTYGYIETRAKIAPGQSMWSAFWMLPVSHQDDYELDLYEILGKSPYLFQGADHDWPNVGKTVPYDDPENLTNTWHTYGVDWEPNQITWYIDGKAVGTYTDTSVIPEQPMYLILNLDAGGSFAGPVDASSPAESSWEVDYVRVWQH